MTILPFKLMIFLIWLGSFTLIMLVCYEDLDLGDYEEIGSEIPDHFPVLVIWKDKGTYDAQAVPYRSLKDFTSNLANYTYLVPEGFEKTLNEIVKNQQSRAIKAMNDPQFNGRNSIYAWSANFQILKKYPDGTQLLELVVYPVNYEENIGWYKATKNNFIPQMFRARQFHYRTFASLFPLFFLISLIFPLVVWVIEVYKPSIYQNKYRKKEEKPLLNTFGEIIAGAVGGLIFLLMPTPLTNVIFLAEHINQISMYKNLKDLLYLLYPLGTAIGIYLVGNIGDESGSFKKTLIGCYIWGPISVVCTFIIIILIAILSAILLNASILSNAFYFRIVILIVMSLITSLLATFEFNQTRKGYNRY